MLTSRRVWLAALLVAILIHLDWHLGRPGHHTELSFSLRYHWLLALPVFGGLQLYVRRQWPVEATKVIGIIVFLGMLIGQGLEPLLEVLTSPPGHAPFASAVRWRVFAEFMLAGLATIGIVSVLTRRGRASGGMEAKP